MSAGRLLPAFLATISFASQAGEPQAASVEISLVRNGKQQALTEEARTRIAEQLPKLFATCSINSRDQPQIFTSWRLPTIWEDTEAKDHLKISLGKPIDIRAGRYSTITARKCRVMAKASWPT